VELSLNSTVLKSESQRNGTTGDQHLAKTFKTKPHATHAINLNPDKYKNCFLFLKKLFPAFAHQRAEKIKMLYSHSENFSLSVKFSSRKTLRYSFESVLVRCPRDEVRLSAIIANVYAGD
jgi:hypothetical protein